MFRDEQASFSTVSPQGGPSPPENAARGTKDCFREAALRQTHPVRRSAMGRSLHFLHRGRDAEAQCLRQDQRIRHHAIQECSAVRRDREDVSGQVRGKAQVFRKVPRGGDRLDREFDEDIDVAVMTHFPPRRAAVGDETAAVLLGIDLQGDDDAVCVHPGSGSARFTFLKRDNGCHGGNLQLTVSSFMMPSAKRSCPDRQPSAFAERLGRIKRRAVPDECFRHKGLMSKWIDGNK
ncbi:hypothetical protein [Loktanella atrilutea]|uniref:hypothetical protein n=1 Tax=Loktanella atrilutea TaxID=366533 RepID=UPI001FE3810E|nr:hypothetical protein [Loktanella atrilutea]